MTDKMREAYKMRRAKLAGQLIQGEDWPGAYRRAEEFLSWSCFEAGWKASREAMVIEWPDQHTYTMPDCAGAAILDCRTAFSKAVKVKP